MINVRVIEGKEVIEPKYPYLGKHKQGTMVIFFTAEKTGFVLIAGERPVGMHRDDWIEYNFEPLNGKLVMENK